MKVVEQHFYYSEKVKDDVTHLNESVPSELTDNYERQPFVKVVYFITAFLMITLPFSIFPTAIFKFLTIKETDDVLLELGKTILLLLSSCAFMFLIFKITDYLGDKFVPKRTVNILNTQMMNKDGQVVRLYKLIDAKNSRVGRLLFDVQEYRYFVKDILDLDEREIVESSCKVPKISHRDAYNLIMTIQDMAILTEHEKVAEDEKQSEKEKRKHQEKLERMKAKYQKVNQFSKEDLDNMTDIQTLKAMEDKIQNIRKNEEKTIESWLNNGK